MLPLNRPIKEFYDRVSPTMRERRALGAVFFPDDIAVFKSFRMTSFEALKVVIVCERPYLPSEGENTGLILDSYKANETSAPTPLRNFLKQVESEVGETYAFRNEETFLEHLPPQGVLLMPVSWTTEENNTSLHLAAWMKFSQLVVSALSSRKKLAWILLGKVPQQLSEHIAPSNLVIPSTYPSRTSSRRFREEGLGLRKIQAYLKKNGESTIQW